MRLLRHDPNGFEVVGISTTSKLFVEVAGEPILPLCLGVRETETRAPWNRLMVEQRCAKPPGADSSSQNQPGLAENLFGVLAREIDQLRERGDECRPHGLTLLRDKLEAV